jgi:lipoate-protein ligase A
VAAPAGALPAGLHATYALLGEALRVGLAQLGIQTERGGAGAAGPRAGEFDCFQSLATDELCVDGRKLAGSAQRRTGECVLQHGSLRLAPDPPAARAAAGLELGAATSLAELGFPLGALAVRAALIRGFAEVLGGPFEPAPLTADEQAWARERAAGYAVSVETPHPTGFSRGPAAGR